MDFASVLYQKTGRIARITLNRPERMNAIDTAMPLEIEQAVRTANDDDDIHVIVLSGAGRSFCSGYDLKIFAETPGSTLAFQGMPWDPMVDYRIMKGFTDAYSSLWRSYKPTICRVHGHAVAGGSDIALSCDLVVMAENARIGYPPARVWGCPTTAMWVYRIGAERAKRMLLTGDVIDGLEAKRIGLVSEAVPEDRLDETVEGLAERIASVPKNQLMMQKMMVNQAYDNMGFATTQMVANLFDGIARHTPEGIAFKEQCERQGFHAAVSARDTGRTE